MYAHHVIEDFKKMIQSGQLPNQVYIDSLKLVISKIKSSKQFFLGEFNDLKVPLETTLTDDTPLFLNDASPFTRLPYKCCWFEFTNTFNDVSPEEDVPKRGMIALEVNPSTICVWIVNYMKVLKTWVLSPQSYYIAIGRTLSEDPALLAMIQKINPALLLNPKVKKKIAKSNVFPMPIPGVLTDKQSAEMSFDDQRDLYVLNSALILLNCKNIKEEDNKASGKINKKRRKKGKQELFTYKTLVLDLPAKKSGEDKKSLNSSDESKRIHLCRGHFKIYTNKNPLFGKHTGVYWWQPHLRGDKTVGLVEKDYEIKTVS
jgi:hypothetical protein